MAVPALKREAVATGPVLRLLKGGATRSGPTRRGNRRSAAAHHRRVFNSMLLVLLVAMGLGMMRVQVTVQAAEAALEADALKERIENERIRSESLEADRSALATPSRIESIAQASMGMGVAEEVHYLELPSGSQADSDLDSAGVAATAAPSPRGERFADVLADVMRMAAGEAQVLLVGDAGLATAR